MLNGVDEIHGACCFCPQDKHGRTNMYNPWPNSFVFLWPSRVAKVLV